MGHLTLRIKIEIQKKRKLKTNKNESYPVMTMEQYVNNIIPVTTQSAKTNKDQQGWTWSKKTKMSLCYHCYKTITEETLEIQCLGRKLTNITPLKLYSYVCRESNHPAT